MLFGFNVLDLMTKHDAVNFWLDAAGRLPMLSTAEVLRLANQRDNLKVNSKAYIKTINKIASHNLRLVPIVVKKYMARRDCTWHKDMMADMLQMGYIGLRRAAEKFDPKRGCNFSTYAVPWIKQAVFRGTQYQENLIYLPEHIYTEVNYRKRHGKPSPSRGDHVSAEIFEQGRCAMNVGSTDMLLSGCGSNGGKGDTVFVDILSEDNKLLNKHYEFSNRRSELLDLMSKAGCTSREIAVVTMYLNTGRMSDVSQKLRKLWSCKIKQSECRSIYNVAVDKLRSLA